MMWYEYLIMILLYLVEGIFVIGALFIIVFVCDEIRELLIGIGTGYSVFVFVMVIEKATEENTLDIKNLFFAILVFILVLFLSSISAFMEYDEISLSLMISAIIDGVIAAFAFACLMSIIGIPLGAALWQKDSRY